jgi:predicted PhzF superfamily epimerase YddE/YHI9
MALPIYVVDAFASGEFTGNPAGVCLLPRPAPADWMQHVASEMKHAETSFVYPTRDGFRLRWFTPSVEVDLCGHATLAAAHVLWETGLLPRGREARFFTRSGVLTAVRAPPFIQLDFPADLCHRVKPPPQLTAALGGGFRFVGRGRWDYLVELASPRRVRRLRPDFDRIARLGGRGVIVTSRSDLSEFDFLVRYFAPAAGIPEDPATGSIQCTLAPYWSERLNLSRVRSFQASARGGVLEAESDGIRVHIYGKAITVLEGRLKTSPTGLVRERRPPRSSKLVPREHS